MLTPAEINSWNPLICWLLKIYICHSLINHQFNHQLIKYFDFYTFKSQYKLFMRRYHFLMLKGAIISTINSHYWLQLYQLTFYHLVMSSPTDNQITLSWALTIYIQSRRWNRMQATMGPDNCSVAKSNSLRMYVFALLPRRSPDVTPHVSGIQIPTWIWA